MLNRTLFTLVSVLACSFVASASAAPIVNPVVWLDAQDIDNDGNSLNNPTLGTPISNWADKANAAGIQQGSQNATQATGSLQPTYVPNFQNGQAALLFAADRLDTSSYTMGAFTIFTAFRSNAGQTLLYERGPDVNGNDGEYLATSTGSSIAVRRSPSTNTQKEFAGNWASSATILTSAHTYNGTHAGHLLYVNGNGVTLSNAGALTGNPGVTPASGALHIGARLSNLVPLAGHVSEMLIYDSALNQAAIRIVNNYLSAKYNAAMAVPLTNDRYNYDATGIDYDFDVFGIGAEADGTQTTGSFGTGLTLTEANSSLTAGEYLLAGRTLTAPNGTVTTDLVGTGVAERLGRIWALDKTGSLDATLTFSLDELALNPFDGNYALLYRSGLTGDFTNLGLLGSELGFDISFTVPNLQLQDGYYTLGIVLPAPEPSSIVLLGCGALGLAMRGRRRREQQLVSNA